MAFHVEIRRSIRRAWAFNLDEERMRAEIVEPWLAGRQIELGDRRWEPRESSLRIIEAPELAPADLAHGQGWNAAERSGPDVTRELLASAPPPRQLTLLAEGPGARILLESGGEVEPAVLLEAADALRALAERQDA